MESQEKRKFKRFQFNARVFYPSTATNKYEKTFDISRTGVYVVTTNPMPLGSRPSFVLVPETEEQSFKLNGVVVRHGNSTRPRGMGIHFTELPHDFVTFLDRRFGEEQAAEKRRDTRHDIQVKIKFKSLGDFAIEFTKNISKGGIFFETVKPLPKDRPIDFTIVLPGINLELNCQGKVVYSKENQTGQRTGIGVQFSDLEQDFHKKIEQFFTWCKNHNLQ